MRIGIDLGGTKIEALALADDGRELARRRMATPREDYAGTIGAIADLVTRIEAECGAQGTVGIGIPGSLSPATGLVRNANSTWLIGEKLDRDLAQALNRPVRIENDANCLVLSEAADGAGAGARIVFGVILGTGCGGGITVDGHILTGRNAIAGEWGHNPLPRPSDKDLPLRPCYCGRAGCIETYVCGPALEREYGGSAAEMERAADRGDARALTIRSRHARRLAQALASVVNLLDPDVIVLGGGLSNLPSLYATLPDLMLPHIFSDTATINIRPARHGDSSGVRGAARLWPIR